MTSKFIVKQNKSIFESLKDDLRLVSVFFGNSPCEVTDGISKYSKITDELSSFEIKKLKAKMLYFKLKYGFVYDEFFDYRFIYKSKKVTWNKRKVHVTFIDNNYSLVINR